MAIKLLKIKRHDKLAEDDEQRQPQQVPKNGATDEQVAELTDIKSNGKSDATLADSRTSATKESDKFEAPLVWRNIFLFVVLHSAIPIGLMMIADPNQRPQWRTALWSYMTAYVSGLGITGGAHRLWSHKSYKASFPVELLLMLLQTLAGQNSIYTWCRDHRVHHKFSETNADPHNIKRGFFFAHMGWLCCRKHPEVRAKGALIDMSDLEANPLVMFQHRHFWWLAILIMVVLPTMIPVWCWQEHFWTSFIFSFMIRYLISLHGTWLVNSAAHYHGSRPYDNQIEARESPFVIMFGLGEGFHNYHHTFPFDYSTSEFGKLFNVTTFFIDLFALMGLVYDRRKVDSPTIRMRQLRTGDKKPTEADSEHGQGDKDSKQNGSTAQTAELSKLDVSRKLVSSFNMDYISGPTSLKYTM